MKDLLIRIALWASAGLAVSLAWGLYFANANKALAIGPAVYALARLTQPAIGILLYLKPNLPLGLTFVVIANAVTYALFGLIVESARRNRRMRPAE